MATTTLTLDTPKRIAMDGSAEVVSVPAGTRQLMMYFTAAGKYAWTGTDGVGLANDHMPVASATTLQRWMPGSRGGQQATSAGKLLYVEAAGGNHLYIEAIS